MEALAAADHPTAGELYGIIKEEHPSISRGTVFRVLSNFAEEGEIVKLQLSGSCARFDAITSPHAHAHCVNCGKIFDVPLSPSAALAVPPQGFKVFSEKVELTGLCAECAGKEN